MVISLMVKNFGVDFHVVKTLLFRGWSIIAGGITALLIPFFLSANQQGYYYTFSAVLASQIFFELGLNHVLTQLTSHAAAHLRRNSGGQLDGDSKWIASLKSIIVLSKKWHAVMATLFTLILISGGWLFFSQKGTLSTNQWLGAWWLLVMSSALNLAMSARLAICEGLGEVGQVARLRLAQSIVGYILLWVLLISGNGLWCVAAVPMTSAIFTFIWLSQHKTIKFLRNYIPAGADSSGCSGYTYRKDIFPLQWKIAISWVSGYFIFSFLTPTIFAFQGSVAAGKLGLALTIFSAISTIGLSWVSAKIPEFSTLIARGERAKLNKLFCSQAIRAVSATGFCAILFILAVIILGNYYPKIQERLPNLFVLVMLCIATIANAVVFALAAYMRAHKEEPLSLQSVVTAILISAGVYLVAPKGLEAAVAVYSCVTLFVSLPWCFGIYKKFWVRS